MLSRYEIIANLFLENIELTRMVEHCESLLKIDSIEKNLTNKERENLQSSIQEEKRVINKNYHALRKDYIPVLTVADWQKIIELCMDINGKRMLEIYENIKKQTQSVLVDIDEMKIG